MPATRAQLEFAIKQLASRQNTPQVLTGFTRGKTDEEGVIKEDAWHHFKDMVNFCKINRDYALLKDLLLTPNDNTILAYLVAGNDESYYFGFFDAVFNEMEGKQESQHNRLTSAEPLAQQLTSRLTSLAAAQEENNSLAVPDQCLTLIQNDILALQSGTLDLGATIWGSTAEHNMALFYNKLQYLVANKDAELLIKWLFTVNNGMDRATSNVNRDTLFFTVIEHAPAECIQKLARAVIQIGGSTLFENIFATRDSFDNKNFLEIASTNIEEKFVACLIVAAYRSNGLIPANFIGTNLKTWMDAQKLTANVLKGLRLINPELLHQALTLEVEAGRTVLAQYASRGVERLVIDILELMGHNPAYYKDLVASVSGSYETAVEKDRKPIRALLSIFCAQYLFPHKQARDIFLKQYPLDPAAFSQAFQKAKSDFRNQNNLAMLAELVALTLLALKSNAYGEAQKNVLSRRFDDLLISAVEPAAESQALASSSSSGANQKLLDLINNDQKYRCLAEAVMQYKISEQRGLPSLTSLYAAPTANGAGSTVPPGPADLVVSSNLHKNN